jgi:glycosyltransferase involved in cell wall biosynthesis
MQLSEHACVKRLFPFPFNPLRYPHKYFANFLAFMAYILKDGHHYDVIHCHDAETLPFGFILAVMNRKAKIVYDAHEYIRSYLPLPGTLLKKAAFAASFRLYSLYERLFISRVDAVVSVAESLVERLVRDYSLTCRSLCIYNSLEPAKATKAYLAQKCGDTGRKVIVFSGTLDPSREIENVVRVLGFLGGEYCLALLGRWSGEVYREKIYRGIAELGIGERVVEDFIPYPDLTAVLSQATFSIFISVPSTVTLQYSMPNKLWESIAAGVPFVANSSLVEISRFIRTYGVGLVVESHDPRIIAEEILRVVSSGEYDSLRANVMKVREIVGWNREKQKLLDLYQGLA